jgi:hypothetical protein
MTSQQWAEWAQVVAAFAATAALIFTAYQLRYSRKTAGFQALNDFLRTVTEREAGLRKATDPEEHRAALYELLNMLEAYALACNKTLVYGPARKLVADKLVSSLATIRANEHARDALQLAIDSPNTFEHLAKFNGKNRSKIDALVVHYQQAARAQENQ